MKIGDNQFYKFGYRAFLVLKDVMMKNAITNSPCSCHEYITKLSLTPKSAFHILFKMHYYQRFLALLEITEERIAEE